MATSPINVSNLLQAFGLGGSSTIDVTTIVDELMQVNEQPLAAMQTAVTNYKTDISSYGTILSNLTSLQSAVSAMQNSTVSLSAASSNASSFTATASDTASTGTTNVDVSNIATAQSLYSTAFGSEYSPVADLTGSESSTQNLQIQSGSKTTTINIDSSNNTLSGIASAINGAAAGVTATVVQQAPDFVIGAANNKINFSYGGTSYTATITPSDYTGSGLASAITSAMNAQVNPTGTGTSPFTVSYSSSSGFSITNTNSSSANASINWASSSTTLTPQLLGFMPDTGTDPGAETSAVNANSTVTAATAVTGMYALSLVSNSTGAANGIVVKVDESGDNFGTGYSETGSNTDKIGLSALASDAIFGSGNTVASGYSNLTQTSAAADAQFTVAGVPITSSSNSVTTAIPGVTLNLLQSGSGSVTVSADSSTLANELNSMVSAYNTAMSTINTYYQPPPQNSTSSSSQQGLLSGDSVLLTLSNTLRNVTTNLYGTESNLTNNSLAYIGVTHDSSGVLQFNSSQLSTAYGSDSANITTMINNMANSFGASLNNFIETTIPSEQNGYQTQVTATQNQENTFSEQLTYEQTSLTQEYSALSNLVATDNNVSNFLTEETDYQDKQTA